MIKLTTTSGKRVLVNLDHVKEIQEMTKGCWIFFSEENHYGVRESFDEILEMLND